MANIKQWLWKFFIRSTFLLLLLAALSSLIYLRSDLNHRQYRVVVEHNDLLIERGLFLPLGYEAYIPEDQMLLQAYTPLPAYHAASGLLLGPFKERLDLDRALFGLLSLWARECLEQGHLKAFELGKLYITRLEQLPGIAEEQRRELHLLRARLLYDTASQQWQNAYSGLQQAKENLHEAIALGIYNHDEVVALIRRIDEVLVIYSNSKPGDVVPQKK